MRPFRLIRFKWLGILRLGSAPHFLALGLAIGVFMAFVPVIPLQSVLAVGLCLVFGGSKIAALAGAWVSNPVTAPPMYTLCYYLGKSCLPDLNVTLDPALLTLDSFLEQGWRLGLIMVLGGVLSGLPVATATYFATRHFSAVRQRRKTGKAVDARARHGLA